MRKFILLVNLQRRGWKKLPLFFPSLKVKLSVEVALRAKFILLLLVINIVDFLDRAQVMNRA